MKSASVTSLEIRRKKKAMQDNPAVVDLSGIPMDKTDEDIMEQETLTKDLGLDTNRPKMRSEEPARNEHEDMENPAPEREEADPELDEMKSKRKMRLSKMLSR